MVIPSQKHPPWLFCLPCQKKHMHDWMSPLNPCYCISDPKKLCCLNFIRLNSHIASICKNFSSFVSSRALGSREREREWKTRNFMNLKVNCSTYSYPSILMCIEAFQQIFSFFLFPEKISMLPLFQTEIKKWMGCMSEDCFDYHDPKALEWFFDEFCIVIKVSYIEFLRDENSL